MPIHRSSQIWSIFEIDQNIWKYTSVKSNHLNRIHGIQSEMVFFEREIIFKIKWVPISLLLKLTTKKVKKKFPFKGISLIFTSVKRFFPYVVLIQHLHVISVCPLVGWRRCYLCKAIHAHLSLLLRIYVLIAHGCLLNLNSW